MLTRSRRRPTTAASATGLVKAATSPVLRNASQSSFTAGQYPVAFSGSAWQATNPPLQSLDRSYAHLAVGAGLPPRPLPVRHGTPPLNGIISPVPMQSFGSGSPAWRADSRVAIELT